MLKRIALRDITRNPDQPRQTFDRAALEDLANSIAENGLMQPITVRPIYQWPCGRITYDEEGHEPCTISLDLPKLSSSTPQVSSMEKDRLEPAGTDSMSVCRRAKATTGSSFYRNSAPSGMASEASALCATRKTTAHGSARNGLSEERGKSNSSSTASSRTCASSARQPKNCSKTSKNISPKDDATSGQSERTQQFATDGTQFRSLSSPKNSNEPKAPSDIERGDLDSRESHTSGPKRFYVIVAGERRFRAHLILAERGQASEILAHVRRMDENEMQINAILENLQRADISPFEEAMAYRRALDELGLDIAGLAKRLGISQHWRITDRLRLLGLTEDNRTLVAKGVITMTQAYHMAGLSPNGQQAFLKVAMQGHATTSEAGRAVAEMIAAKEAQVEMFAPAPKRASVRSLEDRIESIGGSLQPLFKDGPFRISGTIDPGAGERCLEKLRLLRKHLAQVENELLRAVSVSAAA